MARKSRIDRRRKLRETAPGRVRNKTRKRKAKASLRMRKR